MVDLLKGVSPACKLTLETEKPLVDVKGIARRLNIKPERVYALVRRRLIPFHKVGAQLRFDSEEVLTATRRAINTNINV